MDSDENALATRSKHRLSQRISFFEKQLQTDTQIPLGQENSKYQNARKKIIRAQNPQDESDKNLSENSSEFKQSTEKPNSGPELSVNFPGKRSSTCKKTNPNDNGFSLNTTKKTVSGIPQSGKSTIKCEENDELNSYSQTNDSKLSSNFDLPGKRSSIVLSEEDTQNKNGFFMTIPKKATISQTGKSASSFLSNPHFEEKSSSISSDIDEEEDNTSLKNKIKLFENQKDDNSEECKRAAKEKKEARKVPVKSFNHTLSRRKFDNSKVYRKRSGIVNRGKEYELYSVCHYGFVLSIDKTIADFQISSNNAKFGAFDDIVLEVHTNTKRTEKYAIQFQHFHDTTQIPIQSFESDQGDFSLKNHYESFKKIEKKDFRFVLLTNKKFDHKTEVGGKKEIEIEVNGKSIQMRVVQENLPLVLEKCGFQEHCYKFEIVLEKTTATTTDVFEYKEFLEQFLLCCDQKNLENLKKDIPKMIQETFNCDETAADKYINFILKWNAQEGIKEKLTKSLVQHVLTLQVLDPLIKTLNFDSGSSNAKILQKTISMFDVTVFGKDTVNEVCSIFGDARKKLPQDIGDLNKKYQITPDNVKDSADLDEIECTKMLWVMGKCPLIVQEHPATYKALDLLKVKKFIMLGENNLPPNSSVFQKLADLDNHESLYDDIINNFHCRLADEDVSLNQLIQENASLKDIITTDDLVRMLSEPYSIKTQKMSLPDIYMYRRVIKNVINFKYLERIEKDTLVLVSNATNRKEIEKHVKQGCYTSLEDKGSNFNVWVVEKKCSQKDFDKLCQNNLNKRYHHLEVVDGRLVWYKTVGDLNDLEPHRVAAAPEDAQCLKNLTNNINVIVDEAGTGKSVLLKNLKNELDDGFWTIFLTSYEITTFCNNNYGNYNFGNFEKFLFSTKYNTLKTFDRMLLKRLFTSGKVVYIWDGLDEILPQNFDFVTEFIRTLAKNSIHYVSCRLYLKEKIESKLSVMAHTVDPFDSDDVDYIIEESLKNKFPKDYDTALKKLKKITNDIQLNDFLNIPIQLFMLIEVFVQNYRKNDTLEELFSVGDLYKHFVSQKLKLSYKELGNTLENDYNFKDEQIKNYQEAALVTMFDDNILKQLNIDRQKFIERNNDRNDVFGFYSCVRGQPQFFHYSYADYFVATYFVKHHSKIADFKSLIFDTQHTNVRFFFDVLLAEKSIAHLAALYQNIDVLKKCQNLKIRDKGGRNVLQIVCSWGERYSLLKHEKIGNVYELGDAGGFGVKDESVKYKEVFEYLLQHLDCNEKDEIFAMNALDYARANKTIYAILSIVQKSNNDYLQSKKKNVLCNCLYYAAQFGFHQILETHRDFKVIRIKNGHTLLHIAIECSQFRCVQTLLGQDKYKKCLNNKGKNGETPLHLSAKTGDLQIVKLLIEKGGEITATNDFHQTPLFSAAQYGRHHIVKELINLGVDVDITDKYGRTPLSYACENGHENVVEVFRSCANFKVFDKDGWTPLFYAAKNGRDNIVKLLVECDVDINAFNKTGKSPLLLAAENGHVNTVRVLIKRGVNVNFPDLVFGWTALFYAVKKGHEEVVRVLVENGANVKVLDKAQMTPEKYAKGHREIIKLLKKKM